MNNVQTYTGVLVVHWCPTCGMPYGLDEAFEQRMQNEAKSWCCPFGHWVHFTKSEITKVQEKLAASERERQYERTRRIAAQDQAQAAERRSAALKGHLTRLRNRIASGVCPWCKRSFENVERHVTSKHPEHVHKMREAASA